MARDRYIAFPYADRFAAVQAGLPGGALPWLADMRADAIRRVRDDGLPTQRIEAWKYTNLNALVKGDYSPAAETPSSAAPRDGLLAWDADAHRLVFANGRFQSSLSEIGALPDGVVLRPLSETLADEAELVEAHLGHLAAANGNALVSLNTAFWGDGLVLHLPRGARLDQPVHAIFLGDGAAGATAFHPRLLVVAEESSEAVLIESHIGSGDYWSNPLAEITLGRNARLAHYKLQDEAREATHLSHSRIALGRDSSYESFVMSAGARLSRNEISVVLDGEGAEARLLGGYMGTGDQHLDTSTLIEHAKPHGTSQELYKGALDGKARGVFQGKIAVLEDAQKTDAHMLNKTLMLSGEAEIDTKPELEIYADDVKCGHGATAGEIEEDALFYLRARGIGEDRARSMLTEAFLKDAVEQVRFAPVRDRLDSLVSGWLAAH